MLVTFDDNVGEVSTKAKGKVRDREKRRNTAKRKLRVGEDTMHESAWPERDYPFDKDKQGRDGMMRRVGMNVLVTIERTRQPTS